MSDEGRFDPRYSPEFQRGYEHGSHDRTVEPPQVPARVAPMPVAPVPDRVVRPAEGPDRMEMLLSGSTDTADDAEDVVAPPEPRPWRNPYLISLAIIGAAMTIAGVTLYRWAVTRMYSGQIGGGETTEDARLDWIWVQVAWGIAPLLCLAGVLTVIGVVFFLATRWTPGSSRTSDADGELDE